MGPSTNSRESGVLLMDWENLVGSILRRGKTIERSYLDDLWAFANRRCGGQDSNRAPRQGARWAGPHPVNLCNTGDRDTANPVLGVLSALIAAAP